MKRNILALWLAALLLLSGCGQSPEPEEGQVHILATTYPVYLFTTALTEGVEGIQVSLLVNSQTSCLHDYTLTVQDMRAIEGADIIVMNGAGLEEFMDDALAQSEAAVIDCSAGMELLPTLEHHGHDGHDHEEEYDPHFWMAPDKAEKMIKTIARALMDLDPNHAETYEGYYQIPFCVWDHFQLSYSKDIEAVAGKPLITFHDGFQYFADAFDLELVKAIEEEEGATASAAEIKEVVSLIEKYDIPAIFVEKNGSRATADVIARETGCGVYELDMLMSGNGSGIQAYLDAMDQNIKTILEALQ